MIINKFQGKTEEEAKKKAKEKLGENCVVMNVREIKPKGMFKGFKSSTYEVTAALEEKEDYGYGSISKPKKISDSINLTADENIVIPPPEKEFVIPKTPIRPVTRKQEIPQEPAANLKKANIIEQNEDEVLQSIEKRLDNLTNLLDEKNIPVNPLSQEELNYIRLIYSTLLDNEVNEKYANQVVEEIEKTIRPGNNLDMILSNFYQKLVLRFGRPQAISLNEHKPKVVFFIGPTGVGKTTTIAKISSKFKLDAHKDIALVTADTYRIAATEQLNVYAEILEVPLKVVYSSEELNEAIAEFADKDVIFVDTAGFSHKNEEQRNSVKKLIAEIPAEIEKEVFLVLSATTKYKDLCNIADIYKDIANYKLIFTKLDETDTYGNLLNIRLYTKTELSYITTGQNVPNDIELLDTQKIVKQLLGGN